MPRHTKNQPGKPHERATESTDEERRHGDAAYLEIVSSTRVTYQEAVLSMMKLVEAQWPLRDPRCSVRFVTSWDDGSLRLGFEAVAPERGLAREQLQHLRAVAHGTSPWLGLTDVIDERPWPASEHLHTTFSAEANDVAPIVSRTSLPWRRGHGHVGPWLLAIEILAPGEHPAVDDPALQLESSPAGAPEDSDAFVASAWSAASVLADIRLYGVGSSGAVIEALLAADVSADGRLVPLRARSEAEASISEVPVRLLGHLLATPARVEGLLPERTASATADAFALMDDAPTPHELFVGASGQGKTTGLSERGRRAIASGETTVAVDVHDGDFVRRLYQAAVRAGRPALYLAWLPGTVGVIPTMRMSDPPPGVAREQHVEDQWTMLRHDVWPDASPEWFGPVGERVTRVGLALATYDPARQFALSCMPRLLDPGELRYRTSVLRRVADDELARAVMREIMPMVATKDPDNALAWIVAKFAPFATPTLRTILEGEHHRVPVEEALAQGWSIFVHAPAGLLGDDAARILIAVFLNRVWSAVRRGNHPAPITILLDEWQKYASRLTTTMLAEARKFGARLIMANQNLAQLPLPLRESVLSNTGSIAAYRLGPGDAQVLDGLYPTIPTRVMQTLPRHTFALTTFETDLVAVGPEPLPPSQSEPPSWEEQLLGFWGGPEPQAPEAPPHESDDDADDEIEAVLGNGTLDAWLRDRKARSGR